MMFDLRIDDVMAHIAVAISVAMLVAASWHAFGKGRIYGVLYGALGMYGLLTLSLLPELAAEFSPDRFLGPLGQLRS